MTRSSASGTSSSARYETPAEPTSSGWPPLSRNTAGSPHASASSSAFEQGSSRLGAEIDVVRAQQVGDLVRGHRPDRPDPLEPLGGLTDERELVATPVEVAVEPREGLCALSRIRGPARRDDPRACARCTGSRAAGGWKIAGSTVFGMTTGSRSSSPSSRVLLEAVARLQRRSRSRARGSARTSLASVPSSNPR